MNTDFAARTCLYLRPDLRHNEKIAQGVNFMGTIVQRSLSDGTLRYRAVIRIQRKDYPAFRARKTLSTKWIVEKWIKKFLITKKSIMKLSSMDLSNHVALRKTYCPKVRVSPVVQSIIFMNCCKEVY